MKVLQRRKQKKRKVSDRSTQVNKVYLMCKFMMSCVIFGYHMLLNEVQVGPDKLEVVASFCYLGGMLSAGGGCEMAVTAHVKTAWKKFRELLPVLKSRHLSYRTRGHVYSSCVRSAMLHASETWPLPACSACSPMIGP